MGEQTAEDSTRVRAGGGKSRMTAETGTPSFDRRQEAEAFLESLRVDGLSAAIEGSMTEDVDFLIISDASPELASILPWMGRHAGRTAALAYAERLSRNQENLAFVVDRLVAEKDEVVVFATVTARVPSTRQEATWDIVFSMRFDAEGLIARYHLIENSYEPARLRRLSGTWSIEADGVTKTVPSES